MKRLLLVALAITGILAAGCIVRFGSLYTQDDTSHFVGLASNLSKVDVIAASVKVDFYDSGNHLLDSKLVSPCTRTLQIGMDSPFEAVPNDGVVANHVQTTVQWLTLGHKTVADLDTDNIAVSTDSGETHITGTIDANEDLRSVNVCAALLNSSGAVVKVGNDSAGNIDDGDSADFDVSMTSDDTATQFELWIDGLRGSDPTAPVVVGPSALSEFATDTGPLSPNDDETAPETTSTFSNPDNAFADDGLFATVTTTDAAEIYEEYGAKAAVPSGATITGIAVPVDLKVNSIDHDPKVEVDLSYDGGTTWLHLSTPKKDITSTDEKTITFGSSTEDWGHTWTRTQLDDDHFRVKVTFTADTTSAKFSLDWIPVIIYFTTS